jgi:hypothetical protein
MKKVAISKRIASVAFAALAMVLAVSAPSQAQGVRGHGFEGGHGGGAMQHRGFEGHHFEGHDFGGRHFERRGFGLAPVVPYYEPYYPPYDEAPNYWYYCSSSGAYYPSVTSCPESWVTLPAG